MNFRIVENVYKLDMCAPVVSIFLTQIDAELAHAANPTRVSRH
jgi:hypothetical protein